MGKAVFLSLLTYVKEMIWLLPILTHDDMPFLKLIIIRKDY
jgi:hypothetical protein